MIADGFGVNLALEVVNNQGQVDIKHLATPGHKQLQGKDITFLFQELPDCVLESIFLGHLCEEVDNILTLLAQIILEERVSSEANELGACS